MDIQAFGTDLDMLSYSGYSLSPEKAVMLDSSLRLLTHAKRLRKIFLFGQIHSNRGSYFLAFGYKKDVIAGRKVFCTADCKQWTALPRVTRPQKRLALMVPSSFDGDPGLRLEVDKEGFESDDETFAALGSVMKEDERLAAVASLLLDEAAALPSREVRLRRGALFKAMDGTVMENKYFSGLTPLEATDLRNYLHCRRPRRRWNENLITRHDYNYSLDFLDPLSADYPPGCWSLQFELSGQVAILRSLLWPGMTCYHVVDTPRCGFMYTGNGRRNIDLPFML